MDSFKTESRTSPQRDEQAPLPWNKIYLSIAVLTILVFAALWAFSKAYE